MLHFGREPENTHIINKIKWIKSSGEYNTTTRLTFYSYWRHFCRDLEAEIEKFERVCAELNRTTADSQVDKTKPVVKKKMKPKVPPKPKFTRFQTDEFGGTEV